MCIYIYIYIHIYAYICIYISTYTYIHMYAYMCMYIFARRMRSGPCERFPDHRRRSLRAFEERVPNVVPLVLLQSNIYSVFLGLGVRVVWKLLAFA